MSHIFRRAQDIAQEANAQISSPQAAYHFLQSIPPLWIGISQPTEDVTNAATVLCTLTHHVYYSPAPHQVQIQIMDDVEKKWTTHVWPWISALLRNFSSSSFTPELTTQIGLDTQEKVLWSSIMLIRHDSSICQHLSTSQCTKAIRTMLKSTPEAVQAVIKTWIYCVEQNHPSLAVYDDSMRLLESTSEDERRFRDIYSRVCMDIPDVMNHFLSFVTYEAARRDQKPRWDCVQYVLFIIEILTYSSRSEHFFPLFVDCRGVARLYAVLECLALHPISRFARLSEEEKHLWLECTRSSARSIMHAFSRRGHIALIQALEGRLLRSIVNSTLIIQFDDRDSTSLPLTNIFQSMIEFMGSYLFYRSVWNLFMKSFKQVTCQREAYTLFLKLRKPDRDRQKDVIAAWRALISQVAAHKKISQEYKGSEEGSVICVNPNCPKIEKQLLKCSRCLRAIYCSTTCQKQDWKEYNHRKICDLSRNSIKHTGFLPVSTKIDESFFRWLTTREVLRRFEDVKKSSEGLKDPITILRFIQVPAVLEVISLERCKEESLNEESDYSFTQRVMDSLMEKSREGYLVVVLTIVKSSVDYAMFIQGIDPHTKHADDTCYD